ncbi:MAG: molybdopterin molybdotransferase MoeA [Parvularcula sp.]
MIDRSTALTHIADISPLAETETIPVADAVGRILASPVTAQMTQPPAAMSAMDGYAVRFADLKEGASFEVIGESAAGAPFSGTTGTGQTVRVFTGSVIPAGTDHVIIQEDVQRTGNQITLSSAQAGRQNIRAAGIDFEKGDTILPAGTRVSPIHLGLIAASNNAEVNVHRRPVIGLLTNGNELVPPGSPLAPGQIIASNGFALSALFQAWGAEVVDFGTLPDDRDTICRAVSNASGIDAFVPVGGASVGDHDHMRPVFKELGFEPVFEKIAVKPGKPTWLFRKQNNVVLGLPGNPASALVCAHIFVRPLIYRLLGLTSDPSWRRVRLKDATKANGNRENFLRGTRETDADGQPLVSVPSNQDSSLLTPFSTADVLVRQPPHQPAQTSGDMVDCLILD